MKLFAFAGGPEAKCPQHPGVGKKSITFVAQYGAVHNAGHIAARGDLGRRNPDLIAMTICVFDRRTVDDAIETRPKRRAHAHGTRFACGVERVTGQ